MISFSCWKRNLFATRRFPDGNAWRCKIWQYILVFIHFDKISNIWQYKLQNLTVHFSVHNFIHFDKISNISGWNEAPKCFIDGSRQLTIVLSSWLSRIYWRRFERKTSNLHSSFQSICCPDFHFSSCIILCISAFSASFSSLIMFSIMEVWLSHFHCYHEISMNSSWINWSARFLSQVMC